jgi:ABC-2 type transport system ATP-binding protein
MKANKEKAGIEGKKKEKVKKKKARPQNVSPKVLFRLIGLKVLSLGPISMAVVVGCLIGLIGYYSLATLYNFPTPILGIPHLLFAVLAGPLILFYLFLFSLVYCLCCCGRVRRLPKGEFSAKTEEDFEKDFLGGRSMAYSYFVKLIYLGYFWKVANILPVGMLVPLNRLMGAKIGKNVSVIVPGTILDPDMVEIGDNTTIGGAAIISGHIAEPGMLELRRIKIGKNCLIGAGSFIWPGVTMEDNVKVGAGAIVLKDTYMPANSVWVGVPAKMIKRGTPEDTSTDEIEVLEGEQSQRPGYEKIEEEHPTHTEGGERYAIRTFGLTKKFGDLTAVNGINLSIKNGELFSLLGPNGAGKTTTIKMLCCLLKPTAGSANVVGHDVWKEPIAVKEIIGISPQETAIAEHLNAWENLALICGIYGLSKEGTRKRSEELLKLMGLIKRAKDQVRKFSGGMQRRLSIAMALISDPQVLFLDEPTLGLDPQARRSMWEQIAELKGKKTILLTTHYLEEADALADRIAIMDEGKIVALGTPNELKNRISDKQTMVVKAKNLTPETTEGLKKMYPEVRETADGVEIRAKELSFDRIVDFLRSKGATIESASMKEPSLDDVFLQLTGKELRE